MKPRPKPQDSGTQDLFRSKLRNIINLQHELVRLGELIDWGHLEAHFAAYYREAGRPGLPIRLVVGLHLLKHIEGWSDEAVGAGSVHAIFLWGRIFSARLSAGAIGDDAFPQAGGGRGAGDLVAGDAGRGASRRGAQCAGDRSGGGGYDGAGKSDRASDRARAAADRDRTVGPTREKNRAAIAAIVCARGAESGDEDGPLPARAAEETRPAPGEISAGALAAADPRRASQDGGVARSGGIVGRAARTHAGTRLAHRPAAARRQGLCVFLARAGNRVHQQGQSARS